MSAPAPFGIVVARRTDPDHPGTVVAVVAYDDQGSPSGDAWAQTRLWAVAVDAAHALDAVHRSLALSAAYVLPGPVGETFYAFTRAADAEAALRTVERLGSA